MSDGSEEAQAATADKAAVGEGGDDLESVEVITAEVEDDGTVVIDDVVAEVDAEGHIVATDEMLEIDLPDGTVIVEETFSVADESRELVVIDEDTTIVAPAEEGTAAEGTAEGNGSVRPT